MLIAQVGAPAESRTLSCSLRKSSPAVGRGIGAACESRTHSPRRVRFYRPTWEPSRSSRLGRSYRARTCSRGFGGRWFTINRNFYGGPSGSRTLTLGLQNRCATAITNSPMWLYDTINVRYLQPPRLASLKGVRLTCTEALVIGGTCRSRTDALPGCNRRP